MTPIISKLYQHHHGGVYIVDSVATHTTTKERLVIYTHLYPFEDSTFARPISEWTEERFKELSPIEIDDLMSKNKLQFQKEITESKERAALEKNKDNV